MLGHLKSLLIAGLLILLAFQTCQKRRAQEQVRTVTDTVYVEQETPRSLPAATPERVTIYDTLTTVEKKTVYVPRVLETYRISPVDPISIDGREVTYTSYDPVAMRWERTLYTAGEKRWDWSVYAEGFYVRMSDY